MRSSLLVGSLTFKQVLLLFVLSMTVAACAQLSITPKSAQRSDPAVASHAIAAEPVLPTEVVVRDFEFSPSAVRENSSPVHRVTDVFRRSSAEERRIEIGRAVASNLSEQTLKRLNKVGLVASRIPSGSNVSVPDNLLLVTGRLIDADEGNRFTRIAFGLGAGESKLDTEVHVFRVAHGERAEVLAFSTHADSGKMPGLIPSMGVGELVLGPITALREVKSAASGGQKIYSAQIDHLASKTGDQVARYLTQYSAAEGWIPQGPSQVGEISRRLICLSD